MSKKRKKKSPLRNEFTDALNVEMAERKISERVQATESKQATENRIEETENRLQDTVEIAAATVETVSVEKISIPKIEIEKVSAEKISVEEIPAKVEIEKAPAKVEEIPAPVTKPKKVAPSAKTSKIEIVKVKTDPKLEKRILKEADNTLFEEKLPKSAPKKSIYRSKAMQRWEQEHEETLPTFEPVPKVEKPRQMSRPEKFGGVIAVVMMVYAFVNLDKPLFFLALSLLAHFLSQPLGAVFGKHAPAVQNAIHSFSIVIFFGAIMFLFTD